MNASLLKKRKAAEDEQEDLPASAATATAGMRHAAPRPMKRNKHFHDDTHPGQGQPPGASAFGLLPVVTQGMLSSAAAGVAIQQRPTWQVVPPLPSQSPGQLGSSGEDIVNESYIHTNNFLRQLHQERQARRQNGSET